MNSEIRYKNLNILYLNVIPKYNLGPILDIIQNPKSLGVNFEQTQKQFSQSLKDIYKPIFKTLILNEVSVNLVVTGYFLELLNKTTGSIDLLLDFIQQTNSQIYIDSYYGNNLSSYYHQDWWVESLAKTHELALKFPRLKIEGVFLPQLYRKLALEKLTKSFAHTKFISRVRSKKSFILDFNLVEFREHENYKTPWIQTQENLECSCLLVPDKLYFSINSILYSKDIKKEVKAFALSLALNTVDRQNQPRAYKVKNLKPDSIARVNPDFSQTLYTPLEKAVIRMWARVAQILWSEYKNGDRDLSSLKEEYAFIQNSEYFFYLSDLAYKNQKIKNFSSPYEAFVNMQALSKKIEIILYNRI